MIKAAKQKGIVGKQGKIEIRTPELPEGTEVEIIVLVPSSEEDATEYLLWATENKKIYRKIVELIDDTLRQPFSGTGKPEPLKHSLKG